MAKIREVESSNGLNLVGDDGRALGPYQFHANTWQHVTEMRIKKRVLYVSWRRGAMNEVWSHVYALDYATWIEQQLLRRLGWCSEQLIYASWNQGLSRVLQAKGRLSSLSSTTQAKCLKFSSKRLTAQDTN